MSRRSGRSTGLAPPSGSRINRGDPLARGLTVWWPMNDGAGLSLHDASGSNAGGSFNSSTSAAAWKPGTHGVGAFADGANSSNNYIVGNAANAALTNFTSSPFTIQIRARISNFGGSNVLFCKGQGYQNDGYYASVNATSFNLGTHQSGANQGTTATVSIALNTTYTYTFVRNGASIRLYLNGVDVTSSPGTHVNPASSTGGLVIANYNAGLNGLLGVTGVFNDLKVWNRALAPSEVRDAYIDYQRPGFVPKRRAVITVFGGGGALSGTATIATTASGTLSGKGALSGTASIASTASGTLSGKGALSGTASIVTTGSGTLSGGGALSGTAAIATTASGTLSGLATGTTWNASDKAAGITLSNANLTATSTVATSALVRSTTSKSSGKWYWEVTLSTVTSDIAVGICNATEPLTVPGGLGADVNGLGFYAVSPAQATYINSVQLNNGSTASVNGAVVSFALDVPNGLIWISTAVMRAAGASWNNSGTANPATGTGGQSLSTLGAFPWFAAFNDDQSGGVATANFGASTFNQTVPTGFPAWNGTSGALSGTASIVTTASGTLTGNGALAGTATIVTTASGTLSGKGALSGTASIATTASGTLTNASSPGPLSGTAVIVTTASGTLSGAGALAGTAIIAVTASGASNNTGALIAPAPTAVGSGSGGGGGLPASAASRPDNMAAGVVARELVRDDDETDIEALIALGLFS